MLTRTIRTTLVIGLFTLTMLSFANARLDLQSATTTFPSAKDTNRKVINEEFARALGMNYETAVADLLWILTITDFTNTWINERRISSALEPNVRSVVEADPQFYPVYDWYAGANLTRRTRITEEDIERTNAVLELGMDAFPSDPSLPYSAGLNYVGYSDPRDKERRIRELTRGVEYLTRASQIPGAPANTPLMIGWMKQRLRNLKGDTVAAEDRAQELEFNRRLYLATSDPEMRSAIETNLIALGANTDELFLEIKEQQERLHMIHQRRAPFLTLDLWLSITPGDSIQTDYDTTD